MASVQTPPAPDDHRFALVVGGELATAEGHRPLVHAKIVHADDHLVFTISASRAVDVFVVYCDSQAKQQVYGPVLAGPEATIDVPQRGPFVIDHNAGLEHVFIVASAEPLRTTDPKLDRILRAQGSEHPCADNLAMTTQESRGQPAEGKPHAPTTAVPAPRPAQPNVAVGAPARRPNNYPTAAGKYRIRGMNPHEDTAATIATRSDDDGIAIIAFTFDHQ